MVPEHANPADFYMEIISGRVEHNQKEATPDGALDSSLWASTPSFLTESLSTNNGASMDNEREPATPTTTEQPRPTNFDSVPSIPSDLF